QLERLVPERALRGMRGARDGAGTRVRADSLPVRALGDLPVARYGVPRVSVVSVGWIAPRNGIHLDIPRLARMVVYSANRSCARARSASTVAVAALPAAFRLRRREGCERRSGVARSHGAELSL